MANTTDVMYDKLKARYPAAVVTYQITENFNKGDGALGPNLVWGDAIFGHAGNVSQVVSNQARWSTSGAAIAGPTEDIVIPSPNIDVPDVTLTADITAETHSGTGPYLVDWGFQTRFNPRGTFYDAYGVAFGRDRDVLGPGERWHLWLFRLVRNGIVDPPESERVLLDSDVATIANLTLPGVLTFTSSGSTHSATFTHAGPGPALAVSAEDKRIAGGQVDVGWGPVTPVDGATSITVDNFQATATVPETAADLLRRYRIDNNLPTWESYVAHVAGASSSLNFADDENAFWTAFVP